VIEVPRFSMTVSSLHARLPEAHGNSVGEPSSSPGAPGMGVTLEVKVLLEGD
jgi:hypothetical protein